MSSGSLVDLQTFKRRHLPSLERDQPRFNLMIGLLARADRAPKTLRLWSFGDGTRCALQTPPHLIVLGDLHEDDAVRLASEVKDLDFLGCSGANDGPKQFADKLAASGLHLRLGMPQTIMVLKKPPRYPGAKGFGRVLQQKDLPSFIDWVLGFHKDAELPEAPPSREQIVKTAFDRPVYVWEIDRQIVSMASKTRETKDGANVSLVYTSPDFRGQGYAGSVTSYTVEQIFSSGKTVAFLYVDARNPVSNRVYEKIGFKSYCAASTYVKEKK